MATDSEKITALAREYGATVVMRPPDVGGNLVPSKDALIHDVESLGADVIPDIVTFSRCTALLMLAKDIAGPMVIPESSY